MGFVRWYPSPSTATLALNNAIRYSVLIFGIAAISVVAANGQCPAFGADTTCGVVITVSVIQTSNTPCPSTGCVSVSFTGQGPYDGSDDTLVGVVNNSTLPLTSLVLSSGNNIFGFDGDGVDAYGAPGNGLDSTGYGGPNTYFTNYTATTGTVNFVTPIPPGGSTYFSLENTLVSATLCSSVINGSVPRPTLGGPTNNTISATFTPKLSYTLAQAAQACGFIEFDWQSTVRYFPRPAPYWYAAGSTTPATYPHNDPPLTGYAVNPPGTAPNAVVLPVYYNLFTAVTDPLSLLFNETPNGPGPPPPLTLSFYDSPGDVCLPGGLMSYRQYAVTNGQAPASCLTGVPAGANTKAYPLCPGGLPCEAFTTHLVGINGVSSVGAPFVVDTGIGYDWTTTWSGTTGGISILNSSLPPDPGSGTGGITVTNVNDITSYQYPKSFGVTGINGNPVVQPPSTSTLLTMDQISATASGLAYSRVTQTFSGTVIITNVGSSAIAGPFQVVLNSLTAGVTLANATTTFGGWPYVTVPAVGTLGPGQSATVNVEFKNPSNATITFSPITYSGSFN